MSASSHSRGGLSDRSRSPWFPGAGILGYLSRVGINLALLLTRTKRTPRLGPVFSRLEQRLIVLPTEGTSASRH